MRLNDQPAFLTGSVGDGRIKHSGEMLAVKLQITIFASVRWRMAVVDG